MGGYGTIEWRTVGDLLGHNHREIVVTLFITMNHGLVVYTIDIFHLLRQPLEFKSTKILFKPNPSNRVIHPFQFPMDQFIDVIVTYQ